MGHSVFPIIHQLCKKKKGKNMEKENIITVDIEDFKDSQHVLDYIDDDFAIVNSLEGTPYSNTELFSHRGLYRRVHPARCQLPDLQVAGGRAAARSAQHDYQPYDA